MRPRQYYEYQIGRDGHSVYVRDHPGEEPTVILMHGFPDNLHLYDRLIPHLHGRRVVAFDFLGWGSSDKPTGRRYTPEGQAADLQAVIQGLGLREVILVAHDASGPPAIDWALANPESTAGLVLLNTYYSAMSGLRRPEAIVLYSTPILRNLTRWIATWRPTLDRRLYTWQVGEFITDPRTRQELVPLLYSQFQAARPAFWSLNSNLLSAVISRRRKLNEIREFNRPVRIIFGARDRYLNTRVARRFHRHFPNSELFLIPRARHFVQVDAPQQVAQLILGLKAGQNGWPSAAHA